VFESSMPSSQLNITFGLLEDVAGSLMAGNKMS